jgi:hypothetical protein
MSTISKAEMLGRIVASGEIPFRIKYVRSQGKRAGEIVFLTAYYGAPKPRARGNQQEAAKVQTRQTRKSHLESNTIPLTEFGSGKMLTPFISHIIEFNGKKVIH